MNTGHTLLTLAAARDSEAMKYPRESVAYLATPYTKYPHGLERAFADACRITAQLTQCHIKVYSPIVHCHSLCLYSDLDPLDYSIWKPINMAMLSICDPLIVAHMEGWDKSEGIADEVKVFEQLGKRIYDLDPECFTMVQRR